MHEKELYPFDIQKSFWLCNKLFDIIISTLCLTGRWVVTYTWFLIRSILQRNSLPPTFIISIVPSFWYITNYPVWHFQKSAFQILNVEFIVTYFHSFSYRISDSVSIYCILRIFLSFFEIWYCHQTTYGRNNLQKMSNFFLDCLLSLKIYNFRKQWPRACFYLSGSLHS